MVCGFEDSFGFIPIITYIPIITTSYIPSSLLTDHIMTDFHAFLCNPLQVPDGLG